MNDEYSSGPPMAGTSPAHAGSSGARTESDSERSSRESSVDTSSSVHSKHLQSADEVDATRNLPVQKSSSFPSPSSPAAFSFQERDSLNRNQFNSLKNIYSSSENHSYICPSLPNIDGTGISKEQPPVTPTQLYNQRIVSECVIRSPRGNDDANISSGNNILIYVVPSVIILMGLVFHGMGSTNENSRYTQSNFQDDLNRIFTDYEIRGDTMLKIQTAIRTTFRKEDTSSIVFLYSSMDEERAKEIVRKVAQVSAKFLRNETDSASPIIVKTSDLNMETSEELLWKYKKDLQDQGVMLFDDLEDIPVNLAMALHFYCDEYDPLVKKTAILFTLNLSKCRKKVGETYHAVAESCLMDKWSTLHEDRLPALLNRVVNVVVDLDTEPTP